MFLKHFLFITGISPWKRTGPFIWTNLHSPKDVWLKVISLFHHYLPLEKSRALHLKKIESYLPNDALYQVWLKLALCFWRRRFLNFVSNFHYFVNYLPLEKGVILYHAPRKRSLGGISFLSVCLSVCVCPSVRPSFCLSVPCLWIIFCPLIFWKMGEWIFWKFVH